MILAMLLFGCLPETPTIWKDAFAGPKAACSLIVRQAVESRHLRFLRSTAILGLARWLYPIDLLQLMNSATMMWTYLVRTISVVVYPAKLTSRIDNILSQKNAVELVLFANLVRLTRWIFHLWTAQSYSVFQSPHPGLDMGMLFIGIMAVISGRSRSAGNRLS
jgi:hypothetical protein